MKCNEKYSLTDVERQTDKLTDRQTDRRNGCNQISDSYCLHTKRSVQVFNVKHFNFYLQFTSVQIFVLTKEATQTLREHANTTQKSPRSLDLVIEAKTFLLWCDGATMPPAVSTISHLAEWTQTFPDTHRLLLDSLWLIETIVCLFFCK